MIHKDRVTIIVITLKPSQMDEDCLNSIIMHTKYHPYDIVFVDNSIKNRTLSTLWNEYIEKSHSNFICLLNNDTSVSEGWLSNMMKTMTSDDRVGAVGPSTNNSGNVQSSFKQAQLGIKPPNEIEVDMEKTYGKKWQLSGFCLLIDKRAWFDVGGFSLKYGHYGQENEFLHLMQKRGYKTIWRRDASVYHIGQATSSTLTNFDDKKEREKANKLYQLALKQ